MIYLVEVEAHDGSGVQTLYLGTEGLTTRPTDTPANAYYAPRIIDPGNFERHLFGTGTTRGASQVGAGDVVLASGDPANGTNLDAWLGYAFNGRPVTIKVLDSIELPIASAQILFRGTAEQIVADDPINKIALRFHDRLSDLEKPLLTERYAGTTINNGPTAEGNVDLKDQVKPRIWGRVTNAPCVAVNVFDLIYQVSASAVASIAVFDGAIPLNQGADFPTVAALQAAPVLAGSFITCLALGLFRLGAKPAATITADVVQGTTDAARTAAQVVRGMLLSFGLTAAEVPTPSFAALDALNSAQVGIRVDGDMTALAAAATVLDSIGGWLAPDRLGVFYVGRLGLPSSDPGETYGDYEFLDNPARLDVLDDSKGIPSWRATVRWGRSHVVQGDNDVWGLATTARRSLVSTEWRESKVESPAVKTLNPAAPEIAIDSCLAFEADAVAEATRLQALYGVRRDRYRIKVHVSVAEAAQLGSVVRLQHPRLGLAAGKNFTVIGRTDEYVEDTVTLDCWG